MEFAENELIGGSGLTAFSATTVFPDSIARLGIVGLLDQLLTVDRLE